MSSTTRRTNPAAIDDGAAPPAAAASGNGPASSRDARRRRSRRPTGLPSTSEQILQHAVEEAARLLEADGAMIYLLDESDGALHFAHDAGIANLHGRRWVRRLRLRIGEGMFGVAVGERRVVVTTHYSGDAAFAHASSTDRFVREVGLESMVVAPLVAGDRIFGGLGTFSRRVAAFNEAQVALVRGLADHAAAAIANALLIEELASSRAELERRADAERALREIANRISSIRDSADVIQQTVDEAARLLHADGARIDLIDPVLGLLRWAYQSGDDRPSDDVWPEDPDERLDQGVSGKAVVEGDVFWTGDYLADERFAHGRGSDHYIRATGIRSVMAAPLIGEHGPFGALTVYTSRPDAWTADDAALLVALASEAAIAITNARLLEDLGRSREALARRAEAEQALRELATRITAIREPAELFQHVIDAAARLVRADGAILDLLDSERGVLRWSYDTGVRALFTAEEVAELWIPLGIGATGLAVSEDRVVLVGEDPAGQFPASDLNDTFFARTGFRSMIIVPVSSDAGPLGALEVYARQPFAFDEADAAVVRSLADQAAIAIQNARLIEELARSREENARQADRERTLREIAAQMTAIRDPTELLQAVIDSATRLLAADGGMIDLMGTGDDALALGAATDGGVAGDASLLREVEFAPDAGVSGLAVTTGAVEWTGSYLDDERFRHTQERDRWVAAAEIRSVIAAPLLIAGRPVGAITIYAAERDRFDEASAATLKALADQAALTIANAQLIGQLERTREEVERRADAERGLRQISANISAIRDPDDVLQQTVNEASRLLRADGAIIDLLDEEAGVLRSAYDTGMFRELDDRRFLAASVPLGEGIAGRAVVERRVIRTGDYLAHEYARVAAADEFVGQFGIRSVIVAPVIGEAGAVGAIEVYARRPDAFDDLDASILGGLADQAAIAIQNARLIETINRSRDEVRRRAETEATLRRINSSLSAIRDPDVILQQTVDEAQRLLQSDNARIDLLDGSVLYWTYASGDPAVATRRHASYSAIPVGTGVSGTAVARGLPFRTGDYLADTSFVHRQAQDDYIESHGVRSALAVPLIGEAGPLGSLTVSTAQADFYGDDHAELLQALADQAAIAIQNAELIEQLERSRGEIRRRAEAEEALRRMAADISALRDADAILQQAVDEAKRLLDSRDARIDLVVDGRLRWAFTATGPDLARLRAIDEDFALGEGTAGRAVETGRPVVSGDYLVDERFVHTDEADAFIRRSGYRSVLAVPLLGEAGALGALSVASDRLDAYDDEAGELLQALADQAAIAIQNARLIERLERSREENARRAETERSLREMAARVTELRDPEGLLRQVVEETRRLLGSDGAHLTRMSEDGSHVVPVVVAGVMDEATEAWLKTQEFPIDGGINGLAAGRGEPVWTADYLADERIPLEADDIGTAERLGLRGMAAVPLRSPEMGTIGTLAVSFAAPHRFEADEIALLRGLADHAAIAVTNTSLYQRLRESEGRYRHLVQNSPDLVWSIDADARFSFVSDTCERLTGWKPEEVLGRHFGALVHERSEEAARMDWTSGMTEGNQEIRGRLYLLHRDGHAIPAEFAAIGTLDANGRFLGANGSVRDMSEQDRLERELRDSESRFRQLVQASPDLIWRADAEGRFLFLADAVDTVFGWRPGELVGQPFSVLVDDESIGSANENYAALATEPDVVRHVPLVLHRRDGSTFAAEVTAIGIVENGRFVGGQGTVRDVSERQRLERELRESRERYRFLLQNAPDIIFSTDAAGRFTYLSETIERLTGWTPGEMAGRHFGELVVRTSRSEAESRWAEIVADPTMSRVVVVDFRHRDGGRSPFEISVVGMADENGRFAGVHGSARDVSEREALERDLRRQAAELASGEERAHLARELHDSVTQALFSMTLLTRTTEILTDRDPAAARVKLGELRDLQREALAEMRALIFELRPGNIEQDGLVHALRTHAAALQGRIGLPIVVTSELDGRLPLESEEVLYRIAQEALHNVVKHAAAKQVRLEIARTKAGVRLRIEDDGKGFDPGAVPEGHLGLAGMRARADKIGARLSVVSRAGRGTTVEVTLANARATGADAPSSAE